MSNTIIENMGLLAQDVYDNSLFTIGAVMQQVPDYEVIATSSPSQHGFQALLLKNTGDNESGPEYVFAFRGTEGWPLFTSEALRDLLIADVFQMGTSSIALQFIEACMFVQSTITAHNLERGRTLLQR